MKNYTPKIYQAKTLDWMLDKPKCGLFLDMGLGKTVVSLTGINVLAYAELVVGKTLIIAPKRVAELVWQQEAATWEHTSHLTFSVVTGSAAARTKALDASADVYIINRENVVWLCEHYGGNRLPFDMCIIDESSSFKNHTSKRFKALRRAIRDVPRVVLLTGTPAPRGYINLWSQIYLLDQGARLGRTISEYRARYFTPGQVVNGVTYSYKLRPGAAKEIEARISDICISFQAKDWLDLPPLHPIADFVELSTKAQQAYDQFERDQVLEFIDSGVEVTALSAAAVSNKLLQFANGAVYFGDNHEYQVVHDDKIQQLIDIIEDTQGKAVLVAYSFRHDLDRLLTALAAYKPRQLLTKRDKQDWDEGRIQVMLGHPASMGHGLNMQAGGSIAVWFGITWDLELYQQFNARLHRQGQTMPVYLHHLIARGTEDERVMKVLHGKSSTQQGLMDSLRAKIAKWEGLDAGKGA